MPALPFQYFTLIANALIVVFVIYYFFRLRTKEKELDKQLNKTDAEYHQVVDNALSKERKILDDATTEADHIVTSAQYIDKASREMVNQALEKMVADIQKEALTTAQYFSASYSASLKQIALKSLHDFQDLSKGLQGDLDQQLKTFHTTLLPALQKELEEYKQTRLKQTDQLVATIVQKASQEVFNKSISLDDHHALLVESLEKAKKEGVFS